MRTTMPKEKWNLREIARVDVDDVEYVIVDDGAYTVAMEAVIYDAPTEEDDYSTWCSGEGASIDDHALCARIAEAAMALEIDARLGG